jgi:pimeloyl-ACP methyl ester carboxylesterase/DNA-binding CsgD family transcriptional regulator
VKQKIQICAAEDGVRIAYATVGSGPPLVKTANYLTHLEHDWNGPVWHHWLRGLAQHHTLVRYDERGCGLSDWNVDDFSIEAWVRDLEAVVDALNLEQFPLLGISQGASVSIAYAVKHPEKVTHLILYGGYARGRFHRDLSSEELLQAETMINVIRIGWGKQNPAFRQLFTTMLIPEGTEAQKEWLNELARISATPEKAATMERAFYQIDVTEKARQVTAPTLVLHSRQDSAIPFEEGRLLAALIPEARFVQLESKNHILLEDEPAWTRFLAEIHSFLQVIDPQEDKADPQELFPELTQRELDVLELLAQGASNDAIAEQLVITPKTARNYVSRIYSKLQVERRAQAIVLAREAGLGKEAS